MENHDNDSNRGNLPPSQGSKPTVTRTQKTNLAKSQHKDLKIAVMKMFKHIKRNGMNAPMKTEHINRQLMRQWK